MKSDPHILYIMLVLPALFGITLVSEGVYKITQYQSGWVNIVLGITFLAVVGFGYFYLRGYL